MIRNKLWPKGPSFCRTASPVALPTCDTPSARQPGLFRVADFGLIVSSFRHFPPSLVVFWFNRQFLSTFSLPSHLSKGFYSGETRF